MAEKENHDDEEPVEDVPADDPPNKPGDEHDSDSDLRKEIRRILREELRRSNSGNVRSRDIESEARAAVEAEAKKLTAEKEHAKEHETIREAVKAKPATESAPVKLRRLTRLMWGEP